MGPLPFSSGNLGTLQDGLRQFGSASMGPLPFSSGNEKIRNTMTDEKLGFNGAAAFQQRKFRRGCECRSPPERASMGPLPFSSGNS